MMSTSEIYISEMQKTIREIEADKYGATFLSILEDQEDGHKSLEKRAIDCINEAFNEGKYRESLNGMRRIDEEIMKLLYLYSLNRKWEGDIYNLIFDKSFASCINDDIYLKSANDLRFYGNTGSHGINVYEKTNNLDLDVAVEKMDLSSIAQINAASLSDFIMHSYKHYKRFIMKSEKEIESSYSHDENTDKNIDYSLSLKIEKIKGINKIAAHITPNPHKKIEFTWSINGVVQKYSGKHFLLNRTTANDRISCTVKGTNISCSNIVSELYDDAEYAFEPLSI